MLRVEGAVVRFGDRCALDHVDLDVRDGETVALLGPSGSGKTTLLRAVAGLQPLADGRVLWGDEDLARVRPHERRFGFMFQEYALFPHRDVAGNVAFGLRMAHVDRAEQERRVDEVLGLVGLQSMRTRRVASLSGGEQQRVALARALAVSPRLLMLDEPLGALDRVWRTRLLGEIRALLDRAALPALYVTHDHEEAFAIASRVAVMRDGHVLQVGAPADVWARPASAWVATFLGFGPRVAAEVRDGALHTEWGVIGPPVDAPEGPVAVVLRPDAVRIDPEGTLSATVVRVVFTGAAIEVVVRPSRGQDFVVPVAPRAAPVVGAVVRCSFETDGLLVYADGAD